MSLKDYIRGQRRGKRANKLEREAMDDLFLREAIAGFDRVPGDHSSAIERLEKRIALKGRRSYRRVRIWAAAAILALLIGIPALLFQPEKKDALLTFSDNETSPNPTIQEEAALSFAPDSDVLLDDAPSEPKPEPEPEMEMVMEPEPEMEMVMEPEPEKDIAAEPEMEVIASSVPALAQASKHPQSKTPDILPVTEEAPRTAEVEIAARRISAASNESRLKAADMSLPKLTADSLLLGETELIEYIKKHYDKTICQGKPIQLKIEFHADGNGRLSNIRIKESSCEAIEPEIKRLLSDSLVWNQTSREVTLLIDLKQE